MHGGLCEGGFGSRISGRRGSKELSLSEEEGGDVLEWGFRAARVGEVLSESVEGDASDSAAREESESRWYRVVEVAVGA
jgi:hypothetical protein